MRQLLLVVSLVELDELIANVDLNSFELLKFKFDSSYWCFLTPSILLLLLKLFKLVKGDSNERRGLGHGEKDEEFLSCLYSF